MSFSHQVRSVSLSRGAQQLLVDVDLTLTERSRLAVVGPNGVGKSTLLAVLAGELAPDAGAVTSAPPDLTVGLMRQELRRDDQSVRQRLGEATGVADADREFTAATEALAAGISDAEDRYGVALDRWLAVGAADFEARMESTAADVGLAPEALDRPTSVLSGGEAARVGLAAVVLSRFDLTLLDEPTNDLDLGGLALLESWCTDHLGGLVVVSHDRAFLERTVASVAEIDEHAHTVTVFDGGWEAFLHERDTRRRHGMERHAEYTTERDRLRQRAQRQREWVDRGASRAVKAPADGDKHRKAYNLAQTETLASKASATARALDRLEVVEKPWEGWDLRFTIAAAPRSADVVAALDDAVVERGGFVLGPISIEIRWAERVAVVGPNGSGKSTLIGALLGRLPLASGAQLVGSGVVVGELGQRRDEFDVATEATAARGAAMAPLLEVFQEVADLDLSEVRSVLAKFGLDADAVERPAGSLSPGERTRARLALFQARSVNLLVLDEPTNHLDLPAIEQLESALENYDGTLLLVSHDRRLLENVRLDRHIDLGSRPLHAGPTVPD